MTLHEFLISKGYPQATGLPLDGEYHRFDHAGALSGWYKGRLANGERAVVAFGDFKTSEKFDYIEGEALLSPEGAEVLRAELAQSALLEAQERAKRQEEAALQCTRAWDEGITRGTTAYLVRKGLKKLYGARICPEYTDTLLIPGRDTCGKLWTIQRILPEKTQSGLDKLMKKGGRIEGCFFLIGSPNPEGDLAVCEGFATGASIHEATGMPTVCAFHAGNLLAVSTALRDRYPHARLRICGDDDRFTQRNGKPYNPGREKAEAAALACLGVAVFPRFRDAHSRGSDFNDLHQAEGLEVVKDCILNPPVPQGGKPPGKKKKFSEKLVAEWMLEWTGGKLVRQDKNLFLYDGVKWDELDSQGIDSLKNKINSLCGETLTSKDVSSAFNTFFRYIPAVPEAVNLFEPSRDKVNFKNGTLHIHFRPKEPSELKAQPGRGTHHFEFRFGGHLATDFCTTVIPLDYAPHGELPSNEEYEQMLRNVWPDSDFTAKKDFYEEVLGSCLAPMFPKITFAIGQPGTGKSTLIMLAAKLVGAGNSAGSDITSWGDSFGLEAMVNKLVNFDTDISTTRRISDDLAKKVIDGRVSIRRKNKTNVEARLPAVHIFGANEMPKSAEGMSGAYERRAIILRTDTVQPGKGGGGEFSDWIWAQGSQGVLKAALRGLERLLARGGIYSTPESSREEMRSWGKDNDQVAQFIEAIELGEVRVGQEGETLLIREDASITVDAIYTLFCATVTKIDAGGHNRSRILDRVQFVKRLYRDRRFAPCRINVVRRVSGVGFQP